MAKLYCISGDPVIELSVDEAMEFRTSFYNTQTIISYGRIMVFVRYGSVISGFDWRSGKLKHFQWYIE